MSRWYDIEMDLVSRLLWSTLLAFSLLVAGPAQAEWKQGRAPDGEKTWSVRIGAGQLDGVDGDVRETKRAGATAVTTEGRFLETYSFGDLGLDDDYASIGIEVEKNWPLFTLQADLQYARIDGSAVARRDYAIGVENVSFQGQDYEYMLIPEGQKFDTTMNTFFVDLKGKFTPFHYESEERYISFTPWVLFGLYAVGGDLKIDAGPAQGTTTYEIDPFIYVIGGSGDGTAGALLPEIGIGGELRLGLVPVNGDRAELVFQTDFSFMDVVADTGDFGVSARNEKNVDTQFYNLEFRVQFEYPVDPHMDVLVGFGYKHIEADADIDAKRRAPGETTTEKYDKSANLEFDTFSLFGGVKF